MSTTSVESQPANIQTEINNQAVCILKYELQIEIVQI